MPKRPGKGSITLSLKIPKVYVSQRATPQTSPLDAVGVFRVTLHIESVVNCVMSLKAAHVIDPAQSSIVTLENVSLRKSRRSQ